MRGPRSELYEALETAAAGQESPLSIIISTQAPTDADLLSILIDDAKSKDAPPTTKLILYTADTELDPFSDEAIRQANPHFDVFMNQDEVRNQAESARRMPSREASYRNLVLNQRVNIFNPFISEGAWEACSGPIDESLFESGPCFGGLDLSARNDLTAKVWIAQDADGIWHVKPEFFAPKMGIVERSQRDRVPYDLWASQGLLTATNGASVEYGAVAQSMIDDCD